MELRDNGYYKTKKEQQSLPNNLFLFRQQANISQDKLAEVVDCNRRTIGYIEKGTPVICYHLAGTERSTESELEK